MGLILTRDVSQDVKGAYEHCKLFGKTLGAISRLYREYDATQIVAVGGQLESADLSVTEMEIQPLSLETFQRILTASGNDVSIHHAELLFQKWRVGDQEHIDMLSLTTSLILIADATFGQKIAALFKLFRQIDLEKLSIGNLRRLVHHVVAALCVLLSAKANLDEILEDANFLIPWSVEDEIQVSRPAIATWAASNPLVMRALTLANTRDADVRRGFLRSYNQACMKNPVFDEIQRENKRKARETKHTLRRTAMSGSHRSYIDVGVRRSGTKVESFALRDFGDLYVVYLAVARGTNPWNDSISVTLRTLTTTQQAKSLSRSIAAIVSQEARMKHQSKTVKHTSKPSQISRRDSKLSLLPMVQSKPSMDAHTSHIMKNTFHAKDLKQIATEAGRLKRATSTMFGTNKKTPKSGKGVPFESVAHVQARRCPRGETPPDAEPASLRSITKNFLKHVEIAIRIQSRYRSPPIYNNSDLKDLLRTYDLLAGPDGGDLKKRDFIETSAAFSSRLTHSRVVQGTFRRIFEKNDRLRTTMNLAEFLETTFKGANEEELEGAYALTTDPPVVYRWTVRILKKLFDRLSHHTRSPKVPLYHFLALVVHCKETRHLAVHMHRHQRLKYRYLVSFEEALDVIFVRATMHETHGSVLDWGRGTQPAFTPQQHEDLRILFETIPRMPLSKEVALDPIFVISAVNWIRQDLHFDKDSLSDLCLVYYEDPLAGVDWESFLEIMGWCWSDFFLRFFSARMNIFHADGVDFWKRLQHVSNPQKAWKYLVEVAIKTANVEASLIDDDQKLGILRTQILLDEGVSGGERRGKNGMKRVLNTLTHKVAEARQRIYDRRMASAATFG